MVISAGRVMDPESGTDAVRNIGIAGGKIRAISGGALKGKQTIEAKGLVVAPGFIDMHEHGQEPRNYQFQAHDGVTTSLELEGGTDDVDRWYAEREGKAESKRRQPVEILQHEGRAGHVKATTADGRVVDLAMTLGLLKHSDGTAFGAVAVLRPLVDVEHFAV